MLSKTILLMIDNLNMMRFSLRGNWGPDEFCPFGSYATGIELKVDFILMIAWGYIPFIQIIIIIHLQRWRHCVLDVAEQMMILDLERQGEWNSFVKTIILISLIVIAVNYYGTGSHVPIIWLLKHLLPKLHRRLVSYHHQNNHDYNCQVPPH